MADIIEEKWPKTLVGCIVFFFIIVLIIAAFVPNDMIDRAMETEQGMAQKLLTEADMEKIITKTGSLYSSWMLHSGLRDTVADIFMRKGPSSVAAFEEKASFWFRYLEQRGEALQKIGYHITYRLVLAMYWVPFFVVVVIPSAVGGFMSWKAKRHGFEYSSPFINNNSISLIGWGIVIMLVSILLPAPLPPLIVCTVLIALMPVVFSLLISNLPKRI